MTKKTSLKILSVSCTANAILMFYRLTTGHVWEDDFALYLLQTQYLIESSPRSILEFNAFTVRNSSFPFGPLAYPWGIPLLLTPIYLIAGLNLLALKFLGFLSISCLLLTLYFGYKQRHQPVWLLIFVSLFAFNHWLLTAIDSILSDIPFLFFSTLTLISIERCITRNQILTSVPLDRILIGLLVGSCYLIRSNGILLVPRITMAQLINFCEQPVKLKRYLQLNYQSILLPYVSLALIIFAITYYLPDGGLSNIGHLSISSAEHILDNFLYNLTLPAEFFGHRAIYFVSSFFFAIGVIKFGDSRQLDLAYMVLTFAAYIVWPYQQGLRFLLPILPFYISFMISGIEIFLTNIHQLSWYGRVVRPISLAIALCFLIGQLVYAILIDQKNLVAGRVILDGIGSLASTELFNFIRAERRPEDIIVFRKPRAMHLMTGVKSVMLSDGIVIAKTLPVLLVIDSKNTDYQIDSATLSELIAAHPTDHLFANDQFSIYRIHN